MGFPVGYTELLLPKLFFPLLSLFTLFRRLASGVAVSLGLPDPIATHSSDTDFPSHSLSAFLARDALPVSRFSSLPCPNKPDGCVVCLHEFEDDDEVRLPANCDHVFHRACLDRWIGYDQKTCPLCRAALIPEGVQDSINERLWADAGMDVANAFPDLYGPDDVFMDFSPRVPA